MKHLSDEQLSALLDDALAGSERAACEEHLASCEACRARLAEYSAMDASLGKALTHDPGEAYFADFAERVSARIAAESGAGAAASVAAAATRKRSPWEWLITPRGLTLIGSTAALALVAGLAWMQFHDREIPGSLNEASRTRALADQVPPPAAISPSEPAPLTAAPETPSASAPSGGAPEPSASAQDSRLQANSAPTPQTTAKAPAGASRAREVRFKPSGEEEPSPRALAAPPAGSSGSRLDQREKADAKSSMITEMKRRAIQPAQEKVATRDEMQKAQEAPASGTSAKSRAPALGTPPAAALAPSAEGSPANPMRQSLEDTAELVSPCGTVRDTRGRPIASAQVVALGVETRTAKTGADGRFCLPSLQAGDTLSVLRVGYEPLRVVVGRTALALQLQPVGTLAPQPGPLAVAPKDEAPRLTEGDDAGRRFAWRPPGPVVGNRGARTADVYASEPPAIQLAVSEARRTTAQARRERTAKSYDLAAERWERVGALASGKASIDARYQGLAALREANRIDPVAGRTTRLRARLITFIGSVPDTLPERATALQWQAELTNR